MFTAHTPRLTSSSPLPVAAHCPVLLTTAPSELHPPLTHNTQHNRKAVCCDLRNIPVLIRKRAKSVNCTLKNTFSRLTLPVTTSNLVMIPIQPNTVAPVLSPRPPLNTNTFKSRNGLGLIHLNIRSLIHKLDYVNVLMQQTNPDILILSETWLKKSIKDCDVALDGYTLFRVDRAGRGGGVAVYIKSGLSVSVLNSITKPKCFEFIALQIQLGPSPLVVIGIYRPPSADSESIDSLAKLISMYEDSEMLIMGDFNLNWLNNASDKLKECLSNLNLTQIITEPTRPNLKDSSKSTLIDLVFTNKVYKIVSSGVFELGISDHYPTACVRSAKLEKTNSQTVLKRNFRLFNEQHFLDNLANDFINFIDFRAEISDVQVALQFFTDTFISCVDKHAPFKRLRIKDRTIPWFSNELSTLFNDRNKAWSCARRSGDPQHWLSFRQLRNKCTSAVRKAKSEYFLSLVTSSYSNPAMFWKAVNLEKRKTSNTLPTSVRTDNHVILNKSDILLAFNKHFADVAYLFEKEYPDLSSDNVGCLNVGDHTCFSFRPFHYAEVLDALQALDPRSSTGEDKVNSFILKLAAPIIAEPLRHIFNLSMITGHFPTLWKSAHVIPLHKGGSRHDMNNYRPISKLPCLAKVMESLVNKQLKSFLSAYSVLSSHQSGFRTNHSTISAITSVTNHIISALDKKQHCAAVFVDLSKAFDTVDHEMLLSKLFSIGLSKKCMCLVS